MLSKPTVSANITYNSFALTFLGDEPFAPTDRTFRSSLGYLLEGFGVLKSVSIGHRDIEAALDFYIFEVQDFDILIGHPIENFLLDASTLGKLNFQKNPSRRP
uniref:Uncharacterized protein n=1 Tax=Setaria italica TaxID=4555 RepID=K3YMZ4_SETIT